MVENQPFKTSVSSVVKIIMKIITGGSMGQDYCSHKGKPA